MKKVSREELALHQSGKSEANTIWLAIHGLVYDVTPFVDHHPGGPSVLQAASGTDATAAFDAVDHSEWARNQMKEFCIGHFVSANESLGPSPLSGSLGTGATNVQQQPKVTHHGRRPAGTNSSIASLLRSNVVRLVLAALTVLLLMYIAGIIP